jgi:MarR family transcriptional regulator, negative regulator of the multidrug operon emrRAB
MVSMQMNNTASQFELVEANLQNLSKRMPDVPATGILLCRLLLHVGREMAVMFEQQIRPFGLAEADFRVLTTLFSQPDGVAHPSDLCVRTSQSPANMSRISDALVSRGLITRVSSVHDRRRMVLRITEEGEAFVRQLLPKMFGPLRELLKDFSETEQRQMTSLLKRLGIELDKATAPQIVEQAL